MAFKNLSQLKLLRKSWSCNLEKARAMKQQKIYHCVKENENVVSLTNRLCQNLPLSPSRSVVGDDEIVSTLQHFFGGPADTLGDIFADDETGAHSVTFSCVKRPFEVEILPRETGHLSQARMLRGMGGPMMFDCLGINGLAHVCGLTAQQWDIGLVKGGNVSHNAQAHMLVFNVWAQGGDVSCNAWAHILVDIQCPGLYGFGHLTFGPRVMMSHTTPGPYIFNVWARTFVDLQRVDVSRNIRGHIVVSAQIATDIQYPVSRL
ncbi:hypothetical protein F4604DRAFT_1677027 [Suillus subluteus]|nr:hypothetical protein F4604DRAFT_1677027 [Suillus subluteus]